MNTAPLRTQSIQRLRSRQDSGSLGVAQHLAHLSGDHACVVIHATCHDIDLDVARDLDLMSDDEYAMLMRRLIDDACRPFAGLLPIADLAAALEHDYHYTLMTPAAAEAILKDIPEPALLAALEGFTRLHQLIILIAYPDSNRITCALYNPAYGLKIETLSSMADLPLFYDGHLERDM